MRNGERRNVLLVEILTKRIENTLLGRLDDIGMVKGSIIKDLVPVSLPYGYKGVTHYDGRSNVKAFLLWVANKDQVE